MAKRDPRSELALVRDTVPATKVAKITPIQKVVNESPNELDNVTPGLNDTLGNLMAATEIPMMPDVVHEVSLFELLDQ